MKKTETLSAAAYEAPELELIDIETEQCFAESVSEIDDLTEETWYW